MALLTERTTFTLDVLGRYTANTWQEVLDSQDQTLDAHARPFDVFILGGGTFGPAIASRLFTNDHTRARRILLIEAGPLALPEHVQNLPSLGTDEVWGVPWNSDSPQPQDRNFPGLAFSLGGRSVFWGGWSPHFMPEEIPTPPWPATTRDDLLNPVLNIPDAGGVRTLSLPGPGGRADRRRQPQQLHLRGAARHHAGAAVCRPDRPPGRRDHADRQPRHADRPRAP